MSDSPATSKAEKKVATVEVAVEQTVGKPLLRCCFDQNEQRVFAAGQDRCIWQVPLKDNDQSERTCELQGHESWVLTLATTPDRQTLLSGGGDGRLIWWSLAEAKPNIVHQIDAHQGWVRDLALSPDGQLVASGGNDGKVKVWDARTAKLLQTLEGHAHHIYRVAFHPDGKQLISGDLTCRIHCWDLASGKSLRELHAPSLHRIDKNHNLHLGGTRGLTFDSTGKHLAVSGLRAAPNYLGGEVQPGNVIFDFASGEICKEQKTKENVTTVPWESFFLADETLLVAMGGKEGGYLVFWDLADEDEFHAFKLPDVARDMALNAEKNRVVTAHEDGKLRVSHLKMG